MPPAEHDADFVDSLKKGSALEIFIEEGWWEVEFEAADKGGNYLVSAKRYKVQHTVPINRQRRGLGHAARPV